MAVGRRYRQMSGQRTSEDSGSGGMERGQVTGSPGQVPS